MLRLRFATVAVAAGLGLVCGCSGLSQFSLCGRHRCCPESASCCESMPDCGPIMEDCGPGCPGSYGPLIGPTPSIGPMQTIPPGAVPPSTVPPGGIPELTPPPRLTPTPLSSRRPYVPE
jgi:hypothetical protein